MDEFIGRSQELKTLEERWRSKSSELVVLYGRRRVGKTELIRRLARKKRTLFSVGTRSDARSQIRHFVEELARWMNDPDLTALPITDWDAVFGRLSVGLKKMRGKSLIVLDEFPWMAQASPELPSLLQKWWDREWSRNGKVVLLLCGSYFGFMEREVLSQKSPLFGRRTGVMLLRPLPFVESRQFHKNLPLKEQLKRHLLCGGIPAYHKLLQSSGSLSEGLIRAFFDADAPLAREADFLLMEELKEPKLYFSLLESLGAGRKGMSELAGSLGLQPSRLPYYTKSLMDLHYIERLTPLLTYRSLSERKTLYRIKDPLLRFWFTFVYPHINSIERLEPKMVYATLVAPHLDAYWGIAFEPLAAELLLSGKLLPKLSEPFKVGTYWDKQLQIDFVIALQSGLSYFGEAKWNKIDAKVATAFAQKLAYFKKTMSYEVVLISADGIAASARQLPACRTYSVQELIS
jgi:uncharacterized protein